MSSHREHPIAAWMRVNEIETQGAAARRLGLSQQEVSDYIAWRHVPRPQKLRAISQRVGCSIDALFPDAAKPSRHKKSSRALIVDGHPVEFRRKADRRTSSRRATDRVRA